jgi:hypothetical protein
MLGFVARSEDRALRKPIAAADRKIDALVYELYGLTDEEIKIVEGSGSQGTVFRPAHLEG